MTPWQQSFEEKKIVGLNNKGVACLIRSAFIDLTHGNTIRDTQNAKRSRRQWWLAVEKKTADMSVQVLAFFHAEQPINPFAAFGIAFGMIRMLSMINW